MKPNIILLIACFALLTSACVNTRYSANSEYDDVYFTSADKAQAPVVDAQGTETYTANEDEGNYEYRARTSQRNNFNSYRDDIYDEDDFYFSRRLRRFGSSSSQAWRYYDPYYSNDLYYVMGSSSWNRWNNNGWYSWNRPRFGSSLNWRYANDPFYGGLYDTWGYNYQNYYNYYNPWVNTYYGFAPSFGYNSFFGGGFGGGFGNPYASFGFGGFGNPYCPPYAYTSGGSAGYANSRSWDRYYVGRRASSTSSVATNTGYGRNVRQLQTREDKRKVATAPGYTSTRTNTTSASGMYLAPKTRTQTVTNTRTNASTRPSNTSRVNSRPSGRTSSPSVYTRPNRTNRTATNVRTGTNSNTRPSNNTYTRPSRRTTTRPSNNSYSRPSRNTYSRPSSSRSNSYSRPSSRPSSSSYSRPSSSRPSSRSVRPSSSSSRPSSSARVRP